MHEKPTKMVQESSVGIRAFSRLALVLMAGFVATGSFKMSLDAIVRSASVAPQRSYYAVETVAFSDVDGDGREEFIFFARSDFPKRKLLKVANVEDDVVTVKWSSIRRQLSGAERFLVGNVDQDPEDEVVLFCQSGLMCTNYKKTRVYNWHHGNFTEIGTDELTGTAGALLDINNDGTQEIVLATIREAIGEGAHPVTLKIIRVTATGFDVVHTLDLPHSVRALTAGDLDGDGIDEIITEEESKDGRIHGQLTIYKINPEKGIECVFAANNRAYYVLFFRVFQSGGEPYLFIEKGGHRWKTIFKPSLLADGKYELIPQSAREFRVFGDAIKSTMAYSKDANQYVRLVDAYTLEWIPTDELY